MTTLFPPGIIVSCQALKDEPLYGDSVMAKMALAAVQGGGVAIRANSPEDITTIRAAVDVPIIGLYKVAYSDSPVYITPTPSEVTAVVAAGADIVALDATHRPRPDLHSIQALIDLIHDHGRLVLADVSTADEGVDAERLGCDLVSTTLSGYTDGTRHRRLPDLILLASLIESVSVPVLAEGGISFPEQVYECFELGAYGVVIGSAITRPQIITRRFVDAYRSWRIRKISRPVQLDPRN